MCVGAVWIEIGCRRKDSDLITQGSLLACLSLLVLVNQNFDLPETFWNLTLRFWTVGVFIALFYYSAWRLRNSSAQIPLGPNGTWLSDGFLHVACLLMLPLTLVELPQSVVASAWALFGFALIETGRRWRIPSLRTQGYIAGFLSFPCVFVLQDLNFPLIDRATYSFIIVLLQIVIFNGLFVLLSRERSQRKLLVWEQKSPEMFSILATITLVLLLRVELPTPWVAAGWSVLALVYLLIGTLVSNQNFRTQGYALISVVVLWNPLKPTTNLAIERIAGTALVILLLFACYSVLHLAQSRQRWSPSAGPELFQWLDQNSPGLCFYLAACLLVLLTLQEAPRTLLTILWGVEGLALWAVGMMVRQQRFRLFGLGMLTVCTLKIFLYDLQGLETLPRILSFIVLGLILLLVSFLYTRFNTVLKKLL